MCEENRTTILFADDDEDTRMMFKAALELRGWQVCLASSAEEMLDMINKRCGQGGRCFDIGITDIRFDGSGLDGLSALRQIRKQFPDLPMIVLSGLLEPLSKQEAKRLGADVERKPVDIEAFVNRVEHTLMLTQKGYGGPERRRRSFPKPGCDHRRRKTDHAELAMPEVLQRAHASMASRKVG